MKFKHEHRRHAVRADHRSMLWHSSSDRWHSDACPRHSSMWRTQMLSNDPKWNGSRRSFLGVRLHYNWMHRQPNRYHMRPALTHYKYQMSRPMERLTIAINSQIFATPSDHRCVRIIERQCQVCRPCPVVIHAPASMLRRHFSRKCFASICHVVIMSHYHRFVRLKFS